MSSKGISQNQSFICIASYALHHHCIAPVQDREGREFKNEDGSDNDNASNQNSYFVPKARLSKVPKLFGTILGDIILFVSSK